jgi:DNA-directed RNA polymerase subunit RPC12/RpoP
MEFKCLNCENKIVCDNPWEQSLSQGFLRCSECSGEFIVMFGTWFDDEELLFKDFYLEKTDALDN